MTFLVCIVFFLNLSLFLEGIRDDNTWTMLLGTLGSSYALCVLIRTLTKTV